MWFFYFPCVHGWYKNSAVNIFNLLTSTLIDGSFIQWRVAITVIVSFQPMKTSVLCKVGGPHRFPSWITPFVKCDSASTDGFLRGQLVPGTVTGWRHRWAVRVNNGSLLCFKTNNKDSTWPTSGEFLHIWILPFLSWAWRHLWLDPDKQCSELHICDSVGKVSWDIFATILRLEVLTSLCSTVATVKSY